MKNVELFQKIIDKLPTQPRSYDTSNDSGFWTNGSQILCPSEVEAEILVEFFRDVFSEYENTTVLTGYYDPFEAVNNGEWYDFTGFNYVEIE